MMKRFRNAVLLVPLLGLGCAALVPAIVSRLRVRMEAFAAETGATLAYR
jgi:hypothetical protein